MKIAPVPIKVINIYNNALDLSTKGDYNNALLEYRRAIDVCPTFIEAYNNIGEIYTRIGRNDLARSAYKTALSINKNHKLLLNLGVGYYNDRDYKSAIDYFTESTLLKSDFIEGHFYSGITFFNLKEILSAQKHLDRVVEIDSRHLKANYLLSYIYYDWKDYARTLFYLNNIKDIADDKAFLNRYYGFCHYYLGKYDEAVRYLSLAIEENPKYYLFKDYLKNLTYENKMKEIGDIDARIKDMEMTMMQKEPTLREYTHLSVLYMYKGEYKKAEDMLTTVKKEKI